MRYFRRGRHRANRFSQPVRELIADCQWTGYTLADVMALGSQVWGVRR